MTHNIVKPYIIGVCGGSCSGKTTIASRIVTQLTENNDHAVVVSQDSYYIGGDADTNYDTIESIDFNLMVKHLKELSNGNEINVPTYDFSIHQRTKEIIRLAPAPIIIIEGILIFTNELIRKLCDLKIFVFAHRELMYSRRLQRDTTERGRTADDVETRYLRDVLPAYLAHVEPSQTYADIILMNNTHNIFIGLEILLDHLEKKLLKLR